jgi:gliding motility-associated-like protein
MKNIILLPAVLLFCFLCKGQKLEFDWVNEVSFSKDLFFEGLKIGVDDAGNVYQAGKFTGNKDLDPGPGVFMASSTDFSTYIAKLDADGNFTWCKIITGEGYVKINDLEVDKAGNVYLTGSFNFTADFDPGQGINTLSAEGYIPHCFLLKLDTDGNFAWAKQYRGNPPYGQNSKHLETDDAGNVFLMDHVSGILGFDTLSQSFIMAPDQSTQVIFVLKIAPSGKVLWGNCIDGYSATFLLMRIDPKGNVYFSGSFSNDLDCDPGPGKFFLNTQGVAYYFIKLNADGTFSWAAKNISSYKSFAVGPNGEVLIHDDTGLKKFDTNGLWLWTIPFDYFLGPYSLCMNYLAFDKQGNIYVTSGFGNTTDFDPGPGVHSVTPKGSDLFILKLNPNGSFMNVTTIGYPGSFCYPVDLAIGRTGKIYLRGVYNKTIDFDPGPGDNFLYNPSDTVSVFSLKLVPCITLPGQLDMIACDSFQLNNITYKQSGRYEQNLLSKNNCDSLLVINLQVFSSVKTNNSVSICKGENYLGHTSTGEWVDSFVARSGCDSIVFTSLHVNLPPVVSLGADRNICGEETILLYPGRFENYLWQDGSADSAFLVTSAGTYSVTVSNACGSAGDAIVIQKSSCDIYFPTGFTPNGDGLNDQFKILNAQGLQSYELKVYNRFCEVVFKTTDTAKGWDGTFKNKTAETGAYAWQCIYQKSGVQNVLKGSVVLLR